jgi:hypothetical protein
MYVYKFKNSLLVLIFLSLVLSIRAHWKISFQTHIPCGGNQHQLSASKACAKPKHPGQDQTLAVQMAGTKHAVEREHMY